MIVHLLCHVSFLEASKLLKVIPSYTCLIFTYSISEANMHALHLHRVAMPQQVGAMHLLPLARWWCKNDEKLYSHPS